MRKIISILVALGLVLGLIVMATPALTATCPNSPQGCKVTVTPSVECEIGCYNVTFNTSSVGGLAIGDDIVITFPACAGIAGATATVNTIVAPAVSIVGSEVHISTPVAINASSPVSVVICNVTNCVASTTPYTLSVRTTWDYCNCDTTFTIKTGGKITDATAQWGINSSKNVTVGINWSGSTSILEVYNAGVAVGFGNWSVPAANTTLIITSAYLTTLNLTPCSTTTFIVDFNPGCNSTFVVTAYASANVMLVPGWNLMSLPLIPKHPEIATILADINTRVDAVWYWDACLATPAWKVYKNGTGFTSLTTMEAGKAYWICITPGSSVTLQVDGWVIQCPPSVPPKYCYCTCWNMVGFKSTQVGTNLSNYLQFLSPTGTIQAVMTWNSTAWQVVNSGDTMIVGRGYWMAFNAPACIVPPQLL